jgi:hypothetical protein
MATSPNYNWPEPDNTDLVRNGALAIRTAVDAIDTSLADLQGGTTGQVLSKTSDTDMDFTWSTPNPGDITGVTAGTGISGGGTSGSVTITNSMATEITAKGDLIVGTGNATFDNLPVGTNGFTIVADSVETTGLKWVAPTAAAVNKNYLVNGGFAIAQRGTSFTSGANNDDAYTLDRWYILSDTNDVIDVTQDTSTVPTDGQFAIALDVETVNKKFGIATIIENKDVIGLVGNTVTFSFKAKVSATTKLDNVKAAIVSWSGTADTVTSDIISAWGAEGTNPTLIANATYENSPANLNLTTSYATYSISAAVDTASTKNLILFVWSDVTDTTAGDFLYISQAKLELGSVSSAFVYAGGTFEGELAACQRYYIRYTGSGSSPQVVTAGISVSTTLCNSWVNLPVTMRTTPTAVEFSSLNVSDLVNYNLTVSAVTVDSNTSTPSIFFGTFTHAATSVVNRIAVVRGSSASGYLGISAEL